MARSIFLYLYICLLAVVVSGCCGYSFTGGSVGNAKTVSVDFFPNKAPLVNPTLSQTFTEKLKDKMLREGRLNLVTTDGDFQFSGYISGYSVAPTAVQNESQAQLNRLTITINVKFVNKLDAKQNFEQAFSNFSDFDASRNIIEVESALIDDITDRLVQDIFNRTVNNW